MSDKTTTDIFYERLSAIPDKELADMVEKNVFDVCQNGMTKFRMCVPPHIHDSDIMICELIRRFRSGRQDLKK